MSENTKATIKITALANAGSVIEQATAEASKLVANQPELAVKYIHAAQEAAYLIDTLKRLTEE